MLYHWYDFNSILNRMIQLLDSSINPTRRPGLSSNLSKMKIIQIFMVLILATLSLADLLAQNRLCNNRLIQFFRKSQISAGEIYNETARKTTARILDEISENEKQATLKTHRELRRKYFMAYWRKSNGKMGL